MSTARKSSSLDASKSTPVMPPDSVKDLRSSSNMELFRADGVKPFSVKIAR